MSASPEVGRGSRGVSFDCSQAVIRRPIAGCAYLLFCLAMAAGLSGCGYWINPNAVVPSNPGSPGQAGSITISPSYVVLSPGQKFQFTANSATGGQIEWQVDGVVGGKPETGLVDSAGNYSAPAVLSQSENISVTAALAS